MENLYNQTQRLLADTRSRVHDLVSLTSGDSKGLETRVHENLQQLEQDCYSLENMARKVPPSRREEVRGRVQQLLADYKSIQGAYLNYQQRRATAEQEVLMREELFSMQFQPNSAGTQDTTIAMDHNQAHHERLTSASKGLDDLIDNASNVLGNLKDQRQNLKGIQRKLLNVANTLGLSNTVMRFIERRTTEDKFVFWGCVICSVVIMIVVIKYLA
eukprot:Em0012g1036a